MTRSSNLAKSALASCLLIAGYTAVAAPYGCVTGYEDNTCIQPIHAAAQTPPTCPTSDGWTTTAAAHWIGSGFAPPQCGFQAAPTCGAGLTQTSTPVWNGSSWSAPSCAAPPSDPKSGDYPAMCQAALDPAYTQGGRLPGQFPFTPYTGNVYNLLTVVQISSGQNFSGDSIYSNYSLGPAYSTACSSGDDYLNYCFIKPNGQLDGWYNMPATTTSSGQCNH